MVHPWDNLGSTVLEILTCGRLMFSATIPDKVIIVKCRQDVGLVEHQHCSFKKIDILAAYTPLTCAPKTGSNPGLIWVNTLDYFTRVKVNKLGLPSLKRVEPRLQGVKLSFNNGTA